MLKGATSGTLTVNAAGTAGTNTLTLPAGTTDFSATGGAAQVVKQTSAGGAFTVATVAASEIAGGAALTKGDDTNVTLTLGGAPTTALLAATSITAGWTGQLAVARGGTGAATFTANGVLYGNITGAVLVTSQGAANSVLTANAGAPAFSDSPTVVSLTATTALNASGATTTLGTVSGAVDMGGATSLELPNSAAPPVNADGEIAIDTTVTDFAAGVLKYFATAEMGVVAMPVAEFATPGDGAVPTYNAATDQFEMSVPAGGGDVVGPASATDNAAARFDSTTGKLIQNSALIIADTTGALSRSGDGGIPLQGTNTNDSAAAGYVGEVQSSAVTSGSAVTLTSSATADILGSPLSLGAGAWEVWADIRTASTGAVTWTDIDAGWSNTSVTLPTAGIGQSWRWGGAITTQVGFSTAPAPALLSGSTNFYLVINAAWTGAGTGKAYGKLYARRIR